MAPSKKKTSSTVVGSSSQPVQAEVHAEVQAAPSAKTAASPAAEIETAHAKPTAIDGILEKYGDLLFDFCEAILWSPNNAQLAVRTIFKELNRQKRANGYEEYERAWVLRVACTKLRGFAQRFGRRLSPSEQIMLDASLKPDSRLKQFDSYFHRLPAEDQILLLLRDKYGLAYPEIAAAMGTPEGSLKIRRQQALRSLEEWLWDRA